MTDPGSIEFLPPAHAVQRIGAEVRGALIQAQQVIITRAFASASDFVSTVCDDLKLSLDLPAELADQDPTAVSDRDFSSLTSWWGGILLANHVPASALSAHALNLAHRTQLVRAFADADAALGWAKDKIVGVTRAFPRTARDIECGRNPGDVLDPFILSATQWLLYGGDFQKAVGATVAHKALMILEGLLGHLHEEVLGRMRGNIKNPEPRGENQELYDPNLNPFPGADILQPPSTSGEPLRIHQVKSKTGTLNSSGGARLADQMRLLRMRYAGAEIYSHSLVGGTLRGHRSMGGMLRAEPALIVTVGEAAFQVLTRSSSGAELLLRLYQNAFRLAAEETGYDIDTMAAGITATFHERATTAGEGFLEMLLHEATRGDPSAQDSRTFRRPGSPVR